MFSTYCFVYPTVIYGKYKIFKFYFLAIFKQSYIFTWEMIRKIYFRKYHMESDYLMAKF